MNRLLTLLICVAGLLLPALSGAQQAREDLDDRGYIQAFLEDNLSDLGRDIRIIGFAGALSSKATIEQITIADEEGIWLTLNDVELSWSRTALLSGRIDIDVLSAQEILLPRRPIPAGGAPSPEAGGFTFPELPVSIDIAEIRADRVEIGAPVIGAAAVLSLQGDAHLNGGMASADVAVMRTDGPKGVLSLKGAYSNTDKMLDLAINLEEGPDGIAANLLNLPGLPSTKLNVVGAGPLHDFKADIALATDGKERLTGQVELLGDRSESTANTASDQRFRASLSGDIAPVFLPEYRDFFGDDVSLTANGLRQANGALTLEELRVTTDALALSGQLALSAGGWPEAFALTGRLADPSGKMVLLPFSGEKTEVNSADIVVHYDHAAGDEWRAEALLSTLARDDFTLQDAEIVASGTLLRGEGTAIGQVNGDVRLSASGIVPADDALAMAIGTDLSGDLGFIWQEDGPLRVSGIHLTGADYRLTGDVQADGFKSGVNVEIQEALTVSADDLTRFASLLGVDLSGALHVKLSGAANLLGGAFDLRMAGQGQEVSLGQPRFDPLISGVSTLDLEVVRNEIGTGIPRFVIRTDAAEATLSATLKTDASQGEFNLRIHDTSVVDTGLLGPADVSGSLQQQGAIWNVELEGTAPGDSQFTANGTVQIDGGKADTVQGELRAKIASFAPYRSLVGVQLSGALDVVAKGEVTLTDGQFTASVDGSGRDLAMGQPALDPLIAGPSAITAKLHRGVNTPVLLDELKLTTNELSLTATGQTDGSANRLSFAGSLRDLGVVASGLNGPARADGTAVLQDDVWQVAVTAEGPGGANMRINGDVQSDGSRANLALSGSAHLELINPLIRPRLLSGQAVFDLVLDGPLTLSSLAGGVQVPSGRLVLPTRRLAFDIDGITAQLAAGRAQIDVAASVREGGKITITGPLNLTAPYESDLQISARALHLSDGNLFQTKLDGTASLRGALLGGANLVADLSLGPTEIRVPEATSSSLPIMEGLSHVNEPRAVQQTRRFAGLILDPSASGPTLAYPIDVRLRAPGQIFVRGRGLDAELGGELRLTGSSTDIVPQGQFNLVRGRLDILGKRLSLTEGRVSLQGGFDPFLHFKAESAAEEAQVYINVDGPASSPEVSFTSDPERPQDEVLALLLFGRDITEISAIQALRMAAAVRSLAGKGGEGIVSKLRGSFGLDDLDVSTDADGVATVKAGKYISENIYTDVTVGSDGTSEINLNLNLSPSLTARGSVGSDGDSKLGVFFERDY